MEMSQNQSDSRSGVRKFSFVNMEVSGAKRFENESPVRARRVENFDGEKSLCRIEELKRFMAAEGLTGHFDKDILAFKDMLVKKGIRKVNVSGFKNGSDGHVKIPETRNQ